jgi:hypothetical protein
MYAHQMASMYLKLKQEQEFSMYAFERNFFAKGNCHIGELLDPIICCATQTTAGQGCQMVYF